MQCIRRNKRSLRFSLIGILVKLGMLLSWEHPFLHIHLHAVHLEDADITELADFVGVEEFHATSAFVEVVF